MKKKSLFIVCVLLALSLSANAALIFNILKSSRSAVGSVCGSNIISSFNKAIESNESSRGTFTNLKVEIAKLDNYNKDPNCLLISFYSGFVSGDTSVMEESYDSLQDLGRQGYFPSLEIKYSTSYDGMKENIKMGVNNTQNVGGR